MSKMKNNNIEKRSYDGDVTIAPESRHIEGYAMVFDSQSKDLGFFETISRSALTQELVDSCDVFALFNHDDNKVLARNNSSLSLTVDERGLKYEFDAPNTDLGDELLEHIKRGEMTGSSFAFCVDWDDKESQTWERRDGATYRTINKIASIFDVSPCWSPAYSSTNVSQRALDEAKQLEQREIDAIEEARVKELNEKLDAMLKDIDDIAKP